MHTALTVGLAVAGAIGGVVLDEVGRARFREFLAS